MSKANLKTALSFSVSLLALGAASAAFAQDAKPFQVAAIENPQATPGSIQEIVVTARRRTETVQSVPVGISVVSGEQIANTGNNNIGKLQQLAPTLQFYSSNPRNSAANIRGLGAPFGLTNDGIEQGVGIYIDDVYYSRAASAVFDFLDVDRIEVLRGPQGTLYGKNTTAGAINITTNQPTFNFEAHAEATIGNLEFKQGKAAVSGPISDTLAARLAISSTSRRGTIYNRTSGNWINEQDNIGIRGQLLFKPNDKLDVTLAGDYNKQNPEGFAQIYARVGSSQRPLNRQFAALSAALNYAPPSLNAFDRITDVDASLNAGNVTAGASARIRYKTGNGTLTSVTAWRNWDWKPENDRDFTGLSVVAKSQNPSQQNQYTQELRYNYSGKSFDAVLGGFYYYQRIDTQGTEAQGSAASRWNITPSNVLSNNPATLNGLTALNTQYLKNTSAALFGQLSWRVTDAFTIQPGARLNYDKKAGLYERKVFNGAGAPVLFGPTDAVTVAQLAIYAPQRVTPTFSDWNFSYDLTASYKINSEILAYATYAKTFKSGGINQNGVPADANNVPILAAGTVKPEGVNHFEGGLKTQFWARRATLNISAFHTDIKNFQANVNNGQFGVLRGYLASAQKVRTQGLEADFLIRPSQRLSAYLNGAYTDAKYIKFVDAPCPLELAGGTTVAAGQTPGAAGVPGALSPANCDVSGQRLPGVSKYSFSYGFEVNQPTRLLGEDGQLYFGFDGNYRSRWSSNPSPSRYTWVGAFAVANFRAGFRVPGGVDVSGWVRNAFDRNYYELLVVGPGNTGLIAGQPADPRTYGVTIKASF